MTCKYILIVDDIPDIRETIRDIMELEGFDISIAGNGQDALRVLEDRRQPCLIFLDLMMPVMDGWQFLEVLEKEHGHVLASIPIVVVSAAADVTTVQERYGCHIMKKPCNIEVLVSLAHEYCERNQAC